MPLTINRTITGMLDREQTGSIDRSITAVLDTFTAGAVTSIVSTVWTLIDDATVWTLQDDATVWVVGAPNISGLLVLPPTPPSSVILSATGFSSGFDTGFS